MILNDEAHHVWHPDLAWNQALQFFHNECDGICRAIRFLRYSKRPKRTILQPHSLRYTIRGGRWMQAL